MTAEPSPCRTVSYPLRVGDSPGGLMPAFTRLLIPRPTFDAVVAHARADRPNECCGLLVGVVEDDIARVARSFPVRNDLASPTEYLTNPRDMLDALATARTAGAEVLAIYHSHPTSAPVPSGKDVERNYWGESAAHVIIGLAADEADVRAWWLTETGYRAIDITHDTFEPISKTS